MALVNNGCGQNPSFVCVAQMTISVSDMYIQVICIDMLIVALVNDFRVVCVPDHVRNICNTQHVPSWIHQMKANDFTLYTMNVECIHQCFDAQDLPFGLF